VPFYVPLRDCQATEVMIKSDLAPVWDQASAPQAELRFGVIRSRRPPGVSPSEPLRSCLEQRPGLLEVGRVKSLHKPAIDLG
jgi:hypothetical protein